MITDSQAPEYRSGRCFLFPEGLLEIIKLDEFNVLQNLGLHALTTHCDHTASRRVTLSGHEKAQTGDILMRLRAEPRRVLLNQNQIIYNRWLYNSWKLCSSCRLLFSFHPPTQNYHSRDLIDHILTILPPMSRLIKNLMRCNRTQSFIPKVHR